MYAILFKKILIKYLYVLILNILESITIQVDIPLFLNLPHKKQQILTMTQQLSYT